MYLQCPRFAGLTDCRTLHRTSYIVHLSIYLSYIYCIVHRTSIESAIVCLSPLASSHGLFRKFQSRVWRNLKPVAGP